MSLQNGTDVKTVSSIPGYCSVGLTLSVYYADRQMQEDAAQKIGSFVTQTM